VQASQFLQCLIIYHNTYIATKQSTCEVYDILVKNKLRFSIFCDKLHEID
jgi:hypothetical protein